MKANQLRTLELLWNLFSTAVCAIPSDSVGYPWNSRYMIASGNLLADFRHNLTAESQGQLQVVRLYEMTDDAGVRDMLSFLIDCDTMHQNQWLAAIEELESSGLETAPVPSTFPQELEKSEVAYQFMNTSMGTESSEGRWASGPSMNGKGEFESVRNLVPMGPVPDPNPANPGVHGTNKPGLVERWLGRSERPFRKHPEG